MSRLVSRVIAATLLTAALAACGGNDRGGEAADPAFLTEQGDSLPSPNGDYLASLDAAPESGGVAMSTPVITESGAEVYRDDMDYSHRHGVALRWEDDATLWIISSDVGTARVDQQADGSWVKEWDAEHPWKDD